MGKEAGGRLLIGVDGGASKTRAIVLSEGGVVLGSSEVRSASAYHRDPEDAAGVVVDAARAALARSGATAPVVALGAGLAGADDPTVAERLTRALAGAALASRVSVDHDAAAALAGGTALEPGIVIIAGTGSIAFGIAADGRRARAGGWGPLLDDEGSGYAVGRAVLRTAMRAHDGRGDSTALSDAVMRRFGLASLATLKMAVRGLTVDEIASVAPLAVAAALGGDAAAAAILVRAGGGLAEMVAAVVRMLGWQASEFPLVTAGGMFEAGDLVRLPMMRALAAAECRAALLPARFAPEVGAALIAARAAGFDVAAIIGRLAGRRT